MDVQLKELIETIKSEGVKTAEEKSRSIIGEAEKKANEIISRAKQEAAGIVSDAGSKAAKLEKTGKEALGQAGRDLILSLQSEITKVFTSVVNMETAKVMTGDFLKTAIITLIKSWKTGDVSKIDLLLSEKDFAELEKSLKADLADLLKSGVEIKPLPGIEAGFRVSEKDGSAYFNFTSEGIGTILSEFLNPRLSQVIQEAAREE